MSKKNKTLIAILLVLCVGLVGITIAYFSNSTSIENEFNTNPYGTTIEEEFVSPDNWLPGDTTDKTITVTNSGQVDQAVRISLTEEWKSKNGDTLSGLIDSNGLLTNEEENSEKAAIINFSDNGDFTYSNGYYYYNYKLAPNETTSSLIDSVTFNSKVKNSDDCQTTNNNGIKTITCNTTESGYDGATYTLTLTIETVQYNKYQSAWNAGDSVSIASMKPMNASQLALKSNPVSITNYTDGNVHEMYTFNHAATEQTPALTDYRYIGNDPYNYVYFNCDSLDNQNSETCEVWRIIGVFDVERPDTNDNTQTITETRMKLVRGSILDNILSWNSSNTNDWTDSTLKNFLNDNYYNSKDSLEQFGLKKFARSMVENTKYFLGTEKYDYDNYFGTAEEIYEWERGNKTWNNSDSCINDSQLEDCQHIRTTYWIGKIAVMYPSDQYMVYANNVDSICYSNPFNCYNKENASKGWIYNSNIINNTYNMWLISPYLDESTYSFRSSTSGYLNYGSMYTQYAVRPTLYLSSSINIIDGDGSSSNPYKFGL